MKKTDVLVAWAIVALLAMTAFVQAASAVEAPLRGTLSGRVVTGNSPIVGATVTLYGTASVCGSPDPCTFAPLAVARTRTDSHGRFTINLSKASVMVSKPVWVARAGEPSYWKREKVRERPWPDSLFLTASGGNAGRGMNRAIKLVLALGKVTGLHHVTINELTTVAAIVSRMEVSGTAMARALVDPEYGTLRPIFREGVNSPALFNTLADIVAGCVRSNGPSSAACKGMFAAAPPVDAPRRSPLGGRRPPTDTMAALQNIVLWPQRNTARLFALLPPKPPYTPVLKRPPRAFMVSLNFTGGGLRHPAGIAFDPHAKEVWIANQGGKSVTELGADANDFGEPLSGPGGFTGGGLDAPTAIRFVPVLPAHQSLPAFSTPSIWVANRGDDSLTEIIPAAPHHPALIRITGNGLKAPVDLMEVGREAYSRVNGHVVPLQLIGVISSGDKDVSFFKPLDGAPCGEPVHIAGLKRPSAMGIGTNGIWVADQGANALFVIRAPNAACRGARVLGRITGAELRAPRFMARGSGTVAVTDMRGNTISVFTYGSSVPVAPELVGSPFGGGGLDAPVGIAIDGNYNAWVANSAPGANSISEIGPLTIYRTAGRGLPLSPKKGFPGAGLDRPFGIAIDNNGNVWVTNKGDNSVTVFVGAARAPIFRPYGPYKGFGP